MATRAMRPRIASSLVPWAIFAMILAVGLVASVVAGLSGALIEGPTMAAARDGLVRLAHGDPFLLAAELRGLAMLALVVLVQPLAILGMMLLIERAAGPRVREPKNYLLVWMVQAAFLLFVFLLDYAAGKFGPLPPRPLIEVGPAEGVGGLLLQTLPLYLLALFVGDFFRYWFHRAQHRFAFLWRFHAVHHSPRDLDVLHNITHPVELVGNLILISVPTALLIGVDSGQLYVLAAFITVQAHIHHMNVPMHYGPLGHVLVDNRYHFLHHSRDPADFNSNFAALFPVLDRMFGTYRAPRPGPLPETGLPGNCPTRFSHYLLARWPEADSR